MKPFIISFLVVLLGGGVIGAYVMHSQEASTPVGYHGNGVTTYNSGSPGPLSGADRAIASMPDPSGTGSSAANPGGYANPNQKIVTSKDKAYQDDSLDQEVQMDKDEGKPIKRDQPK